MKKLLLAMVAILATFSFGANAQTVSADFTNLDNLVAKLNQALEKAPKDTDEADVDAFIKGNVDAAKGASESAAKLHTLYSRLNGETADGAAPTVQDFIDLAKSLTTQVAGMKELSDSGEKAANAVKSANKMKAMKLAKPVKWCTDIMPVTAETLTEEVNAVEKIINLLNQ